MEISWAFGGEGDFREPPLAMLLFSMVLGTCLNRQVALFLGGEELGLGGGGDFIDGFRRLA